MQELVKPVKANPKLADGETVELERLQPVERATPAVSSKGMIDRVTVALTVQLGRTDISVKDLRLLRQGQIVVLDQVIGEPLTIFANGHHLAYGEVVATAKDQYGIRVTALMEEHAPSEDEAA
jgi:flagellar motor switch protein FliN/FliY